MSIERGKPRTGDATPQEQLVTLRETLKGYLSAGRDGTSVVEAVRQRIADLEQQARMNLLSVPTNYEDFYSALGAVPTNRNVEHAATQKAAAADPVHVASLFVPVPATKG